MLHEIIPFAQKRETQQVTKRANPKATGFYAGIICYCGECIQPTKRTFEGNTPIAQYRTIQQKRGKYAKRRRVSILISDVISASAYSQPKGYLKETRPLHNIKKGQACEKETGFYADIRSYFSECIQHTKRTFQRKTRTNGFPAGHHLLVVLLGLVKGLQRRRYAYMTTCV